MKKQFNQGEKMNEKSSIVVSLRGAAENGSIVVALQDAMKNDGYISESAVNRIAQNFNVSPSEVYSVASFYHQFTFAKKGKNVIAICEGTACFVCGSEQIKKAVMSALKIKMGEVTADGLFSLEKNTRCLGRCAGAPVVCVNDTFYENATAEMILEAINDIKR
jgi:NADH:ubiquinone oxidoreductase subunit E